MIRYFSILIIIFFSSRCFSKVELNYKNDLYTALNYMKGGVVKQFTTLSGISILTAGAATSVYIDSLKDRHQRKISTKESHSSYDLVSDSTVVFYTPVLPLAAYFYSKRINSKKLFNFSLEYFATLHSTQIQTVLLSAIPVNERPEGADPNPIEKMFRFNSSFPSGHLIPYATLSFKVWQFYGPVWALIPASLTALTTMQRIYDRKHHAVDIVGGIFLAAWVSEGVRHAANSRNSHPYYDILFGKTVSFTPIFGKSYISANLKIQFK